MSNKNKDQAVNTDNSQRWTPSKDGLRQARATGIYYLFVRINGELYRDCCNTTEAAAAKEFLRQKREQVASAQARGVNLKSATTWGFFEQKYRQELDRRVRLGSDHEEGITQSTKETYEQGLARWHALWPDVDEEPIRSITDTQVNKLLDPLRAKISRSQFNRIYIAINEVFKIAFQDKAILVNPLAYVKRSSKRCDNRYIPERNEWDAFLDFILNGKNYTNAFKHQIADFLQGLCVTGLRLDEARHTLKEDVKISTDANGVKYWTLHVRKSKTEAGERVIDLIPPAVTVIEHLLSAYPKSKRLFPIDECYKTFKYVCGPKGLNLSKLDKKGNRVPVRYSHHTCRHIFTTLCIEHGIDNKTISEWLGHGDGGILVANTYGHLRRQFAREQAAKVTNVPLIGIPATAPARVDAANLQAQVAALQAQLAALQAKLPENLVVLPKVKAA